MTRYPVEQQHTAMEGQFTNIIKVTRRGAKQYMDKEVTPSFLKMQKEGSHLIRSLRRENTMFSHQDTFVFLKLNHQF